MAVVNATLPTLLDHARRTDPSGKIADIVEVLKQRLPILGHIPWQEGNLPNGHVYTSRTGLPTPSWRALNEGVGLAKSSTTQVTESCGIMQAMSAVDVEVARFNGNQAAFRASEDAAFLQGFDIEFARALIYESTATNPERMTGIAPRLNSLSGQYGKQVISAGGAGNRTSMYLVNWSPDNVFCIYPKGSTAGLEQKDLGEQVWTDPADSNKKFTAYVTQFTWKLGLVVRDYRQVARIANIDSSATGLTKTGSGTAGFLLDQMLKAYYQIDAPATSGMAWYCNRTIAHYLHLQGQEQAKYGLTTDTIEGRPITRHLGIPIYVLDTITNSEAAVS